MTTPESPVTEAAAHDRETLREEIAVTIAAFFGENDTPDDAADALLSGPLAGVLAQARADALNEAADALYADMGRVAVVGDSVESVRRAVQWLLARAASPVTTEEADRG